MNPPTFKTAFMAVWFTNLAYLASVAWLGMALAAQRLSGKRKGGPYLISINPLDQLKTLKFIFTASEANGESASIVRLTILTRVLFCLAAIGTLGMIGFVAWFMWRP